MALIKRIFDIFTITSGSGFSWAGTASGRWGTVLASPTTFEYQGNPTSKAATAALTAAEVLTKLINYSGAVGTLTMPTAASLDAALPANATTHDAVRLTIMNTGSGTVTLAGASGVTPVAGTTVAVGASGTWLVKKTAATGAYGVYRIA